MRSLVSISCAVISTAWDAVEALDLDLAAGDPEGVPAGRKSLHQPALDVEETGLVVLDHRFRHDGRTVALDHRQVTRGHAGIAGHIDALDID